MEERAWKRKIKIPRRRSIYPEQKFEIVRDIERHATVKRKAFRGKYQIA